jgi:hypothetical protein
MREWQKIDMDTVFQGTDEHGVRYLPEFLSDYESIFHDSASAGCRKCLIQYYNQIAKHLNKMNTETSNFKLKAMFNPIQVGFGSSTMISNNNLTDKVAIELIETHPHGEKLFDIIPSNIEEIRASLKESITTTEGSKKQTRQELDAIATDLGLITSEYKNKQEITDAITAKQTELAAIVVETENTTDPEGSNVPE